MKHLKAFMNGVWESLGDIMKYACLFIAIIYLLVFLFVSAENWLALSAAVALCFATVLHKLDLLLTEKPTDD